MILGYNPQNLSENLYACETAHAGAELVPTHFPSVHQKSFDYKRHLAVTGVVMSTKKSLISYCCFFLMACTLLPLSSLSQETGLNTEHNRRNGGFRYPANICCQNRR